MCVCVCGEGGSGALSRKDSKSLSRRTLGPTCKKKKEEERARTGEGIYRDTIMSQVGSTQRGVLVRCDPAVKQFILHLDQKYRFVIADLDETSVFLDASSGAERIIKEGLEQLNKDNTYESDQPEGKKKGKKRKAK